MTQRSELQEAWTYYSAGQHLSDAERECLQRAFQDKRVGSELVADLQLHRSLETLEDIEASGADFVEDVLAACLETRTAEKPKQDMMPLPIPAPPPLVETIPSKRTTGRRKKRPSVWAHPLVLLLAFSSFVMVLLLAFMVERYGSMKQQIVEVTDQLESQRKKFDRQIIVERTRNRQSAAPPIESTVKPVATQQSAVRPAADGPESFARLTHSEDAVWRTKPTSESLPPGEWELKSGSMELTLIGGSHLFLEGPATINLIGPQHVAVERGNLTALVPPEDLGFRISTPTARIIDLGTEFRVSVSDDGQTDVKLLQGEVVVIPWDDGPTGKRWRLARNEFENVTVSPSAEDGQRMLASRAVGPDGFDGQIRLAGAAIDLDSQDHFDRLHNGVKTKLATSPRDAVADWLELSRTLNTTTGLVNLNGKEIPISGLEGVLDFENLLNGGDFPPAGNSQKNSSFSGTVNINGQQRTFTNPEEYEAFRKEMFQFLPGFGLPGPAQTQFEIDKQTNPFQPK